MFRAALDACMPLVEQGLDGRDALRAERRAGLAVADAVLRIQGIRPEPRNPAPATAVEVAHEVLSAAGPFEPVDASSALASLFEGAVGTQGRQNQGVVYTPSDVVRFMVREALAARVAVVLQVEYDHARAVAGGDPESLEDVDRRRLVRLLGGLRLVDPAVGAGAFLAGAADEISALGSRLREADVAIPAGLRSSRAVLERCCHGFEVDPEATRMAGAVLALACPGSKSVPKVVTTRNTLLGGLDHPTASSGWDIVLMNPPYVGEKHLRKRLGHEFQAELRARDGFSGDLLSHFVLRALEGTRPKGVLSAIVSDTAFTMASAAPVRAALLDETTLFSLAWCRPFAVAAQGGVVTAIRDRPRGDSRVTCYEVGRRDRLDRAGGRRVRRSSFAHIPGRPLFRPSPAATLMAKRWWEIDRLDELWDSVGRRGARRDIEAHVAGLRPGDWTLLGAAAQAGQGLATGDDRRFVGLVAGTAAAQRALQRQRRILEALRTDPSRASEWRVAKRGLSQGHALDDALMAVLDLDDGDGSIDLSGRKPFRVVAPDQVRGTPLTVKERRCGIVGGPCWVPYETGDRSGPAGGARWVRDNPVVIDWGVDSVGLLRRRRAEGPKKPVLRHEELWFRGGVTHNRVASYLRARLLSEHAIFSSESPCYIPNVPWLSQLSLLALLNSPVFEFALKTFLATRNHIELGHVRRLPVPVLSGAQVSELEDLGSRAVTVSRADGQGLDEIEAELDRITRGLYGMPSRYRLPVSR